MSRKQRQYPLGENEWRPRHDHSLTPNCASLFLSRVAQKTFDFSRIRDWSRLSAGLTCQLVTSDPDFGFATAQTLAGLQQTERGVDTVSIEHHNDSDGPTAGISNSESLCAALRRNPGCDFRCLLTRCRRPQALLADPLSLTLMCKLFRGTRGLRMSRRTCKNDGSWMHLH